VGSNNPHRPLKSRQLEIWFITAGRQNGPGVEIAVKEALRVQCLKGKHDASQIAPNARSVRQLPGLGKPMAWHSSFEQCIKRPSLARIEDKIKALTIYPRLT
jgi:hypothetical protein